MNKFDVISSKAIDRAFITEQRQYLTGNLKMPQILDFIKDENVEIGMSRYKEYKVEQPHYHTDLAEYHLILKGETKYANVTENKEYVFKKGDFYIIRPNTIYIQKSLPGTELIFIKVPGINDKVPCESTDRINKWFEEWDNIW